MLTYSLPVVKRKGCLDSTLGEKSDQMLASIENRKFYLSLFFPLLAMIEKNPLNGRNASFNESYLRLTQYSVLKR